MLTTICGVGQYKIQINEAYLTNTSECVKDSVDSSCLVKIS